MELRMPAAFLITDVVCTERWKNSVWNLIQLQFQLQPAVWHAFMQLASYFGLANESWSKFSMFDLHCQVWGCVCCFTLRLVAGCVVFPLFRYARCLQIWSHWDAVIYICLPTAAGFEFCNLGINAFNVLECLASSSQITCELINLNSWLQSPESRDQFDNASFGEACWHLFQVHSWIRSWTVWLHSSA